MWSQIRYIIIDVDGTMTDGGIYYDENGNEFKKFNTKDAVAFWAMQAVGIQPIVITGRRCHAVERRMHDLGVRYLFQGVGNKCEKIKQLMEELHFTKQELGYIGDDLNDFPAMEYASFIACPNDACIEVIQVAHYISNQRGGYGVVRDSVAHLLKCQNKWNNAFQSIVAKYGKE